jgi:omega-amidase
MVWLSTFQYRVEYGDIEKNLQKIESVKNLIPKGGIFLLPEMFCCGFDYSNMENLAKQSETVLSFLKDLSLTTEGVVVGTLPLEENGKLYNTAVVFDNGRLVGRRGKIELFPVYKEPEYFVPAPLEENRVMETSAGKIGIVICFEIRFNKYTNQLRREEVEVILVPAMWGVERRKHFKVLTRARAVETQSFLIASNAWGKTGKTFFGGASGIYSPWGEVLGFIEDGEGIIASYADLSEVKRVRNKIPVRF